jgi:hypothetical protein
MNRFISAFLFASSLFLFQGCSLLTKTVDAADKEQQPMEHHDLKNMGQGSSSEDMGNMNMEDEAVKTETEAKLTVPDAIAPNQSIPLAINIQDSAGKPVSEFDAFQEKLMHLIVVSDDLEFFSHIHPQYKDRGQFDVEATLSKPGNYTLFSDYKPAGDTERVSLMQLSVAGTPGTPTKIDESLTKSEEAPSFYGGVSLTKSFGKTKVSFSTDKEQIKANEPVNLKFDLQDIASNAPITDLQPYLGKTGHLVIIKQSATLTKDDYIHAHASESTALGKVDFETQFPAPGKYKLWGQFNRNGKIVIADFWVDVM